MPWNRRYAIFSYLSSTIWLVPFLAIAIEQATIRLSIASELDLGYIPGFTGNAAAHLAVADFVITLTISLIVFTFGSLLVAIQVASAQLTPRIIATTLLRDPVIRLTIGVFVYSLMLAVAVKVRLAALPDFLTSLVGVMALVCLVMFLLLIDYTARLLRPVSIVWRVAENGLKVIHAVYPNRHRDRVDPLRPAPPTAPVERTVRHRGTSGIVLAVNLPRLVSAARKADGLIEVVPQVGDFVAVEQPLFLLRGGATAINDRVLRGQIAIGRERTIEQDATFAFRVIVDIAIKALSKAINDPTTAVISIDQLHRMLRVVGQRSLSSDSILDADGRVRVTLRTPDWDGFVQLTFTEIRQYGAENFQVARRLRAMILDLVRNLSESRRPALYRELDLLDRTLERYHALPEELALSRVPDTQGLGGVNARTQ